jgi:hypothetical protein
MMSMVAHHLKFVRVVAQSSETMTQDEPTRNFGIYGSLLALHGTVNP